MSYLVMARKWRPALFTEIVGQGHVTRTLTNALSSGRLAHAYLFSGPRGVGKTTAARILAKGLNCERGPTAEPCNSCASCTSIASGSGVDVFEIDGASNTGVDNVRELRESVRYVPTSGRYKIYIIDEVHMLSTAAFNALLKTLEEPPPHAVFIFATTEVHKIPLTILSRCQRFDFRRIPLKEIYSRLVEIVDSENLAYEDGALYTIAREAEGSLRDAQSLLDQVVAFSGESVKDSDVTDALGLMDRTVLVDLLGAVVEGDGGAGLNLVEKIYDFGYDLKRASADMLEYVRNLAVVKVSGKAALVELPEAEAARLEAMAESVGAERLQLLFSIFSGAYREVSGSAMPRYAFEMAVLRAAHAEDLRPVGELIDRLEALASKGPASAPAARAAGRRGAPRKGGRPGPEGPARASEATEPYAPVRPAGRAESAPPEQAKEAPRREATPAPDPDPTPEGFAGFVKKKGAHSLASTLSRLTVAVEGAALTVAGDRGDCNMAGSIQKDRLAALAGEYFGRALNIETKPSDGDGEDAQSRPAEDDKDPILKEAVRMFEGRVIEDRRRQDV